MIPLAIVLVALLVALLVSAQRIHSVHQRLWAEQAAHKETSEGWTRSVRRMDDVENERDHWRERAEHAEADAARLRHDAAETWWAL